jgi:cellulose synthase/poly-beta-1,6-N-acetylglucosamine synthase-like glycosyltransferase
MEFLFWTCVLGILYPYFGYPAILWLLARKAKVSPPASEGETLPSVTLIVPVHNEQSRIERKLANTVALRYPADRLQTLFVSDGSTDRTSDIIRANLTDTMTLVELNARGGKAAALNAGLQRAVNEVLVFSDASIELEPDALVRIVGPFRDPSIGCVTGEDRISEAGGEGLYGRYEVMLRRLESDVHSIVGASGCLYAQRRALCQPFIEGMAPDFLSVLRTVEQGYRAVSEPSSVGTMTSVKDPKHEFERKVRTLLRGMTTLFAHVHLLNPARHGLFAFAVISHKVLRWTVPFCLLGTLLTPLALLPSSFYLFAFTSQVAFYVLATAAFARWANVHHTLAGKVALYFSSVNAAILAAWCQYGRGIRQELWTPSHR